MYYLLTRWRPPPLLVFFSHPAINLAYNKIQSKTKKMYFVRPENMLSIFHPLGAVRTMNM